MSSFSIRKLEQAEERLRRGDIAGARLLCEQVLQRAPRNPGALFLRAMSYLMEGRAGDCIPLFEQAIAGDPRHGPALEHLGLARLMLGRFEEAETVLRRAVALPGAPASVFMRLGASLVHQGRYDEAIAELQRALEIDPRDADSRVNLAQAYAKLGDTAAARAHLETALTLSPQHVAALEALAGVCRALGRFKEAIEHLKAALQIDPDNYEALSGLADALFQHGQVDEARSAAERANTVAPDAPDPYSLLALIHIVRGKHGEAIAVLERGYQRTGADGLLGMLSHELRRTCDWEKWREAWHKMMPRLEHSADLGSPFWLLTEATTAEQQLAYTRRWADARFGAAPPNVPRRRPPAETGGRRLRIGYLSSEFHEHAIAYLIAGMLEAHDRERFEIFAYSYGPEGDSPMRARLRAACEHVVNIAWDPDDVAARRIHDDAIDILVDLKGYTIGARTGILARRPCAIQVNWEGYPGTMGAPFIDCLITDGFIVPEGAETFYSERVLRLSHCWQTNDRKRPTLEPLTRTEYGLPQEAFVFCCFAQSVKITPEIFACWMRLLERIPGSVLWLAQDNRWATHNLERAAQSRGVDPERLIVAPRAPFADYLARYRTANLALDTFPYTSHSTASDALWSGCPLVALCGETFASRVSGSILAHAGLSELITHSLDDYEKLAYRLATDRAFLDDLRSRVAAARDSALFDAQSYARDLEGVYLQLVKEP